MALSAGTRFGSYEVIEPIGSGGMGEVWRARDTALKRDVAIKVLPDSFVDDADRLARFRREAEILASLSHANIAHVYGLEQVDGQTVIVMELVEGPTLADRIEQGPIPPDEALAIARQVADALEAAHNLQIVHRDLKPANVKLRDDGAVKVLDFGISKPIDARAISGGSPAMTTPAVTETGVILGTAAYMSPEQARGRPVDERTDIWAFGCLLFEMLTGQPAFGGEDVMLTLARVLDRDTDLSSMPKTISPAVRHTIGLCLEKDPRKRIADIRDVRLALEGRFETGLPRSDDTGPRTPLFVRLLPVAAGVVVTGLAAAIVAFALWPSPEAAPVVRLSSAINANVVNVAISADGSRLAYADGLPPALFVRRLDDFEFEAVPGAAGGAGILPPCFSPDGNWIAFANTASGLRKTAIAGGGDVPLLEFSANNALPLCHWGADGYIYLSTDDGLVRVRDSGGVPETLIPVGTVESRIAMYPSLLPGQQKVLFAFAPLTLGATGDIAVAVLDLATRETRTLLEAGGLAEFVPERPGSGRGYLVYPRGGSLFAVPFDVDTLEVGSPSIVVNGILSLGPLSFAHVSETGILAYVGGADAALSLPGVLLWVDREGNELVLGAENPVNQAYRLSRDNRRAVVTALDLDDDRVAEDIWIYEFDGGRLTPLTRDGRSQHAVWLSDSTRLVFTRIGLGSVDDRGGRLLLGRADGSGEPVTIATWSAGNPFIANSVSPDDRFVIGARLRSGTGNDIWALQIDESAGEPTEDAFEYLLESPFNETQPSFSPDGRYIAYTSDQSGRTEIYVQSFPGAGGRVLVSVGGGTMPVWNPAGGELYYINGDRLMAVTVETEPEFSRSAPVEVFNSPELLGFLSNYYSASPALFYDVANDGARFLIPTTSRAPTDETWTLNVVVNWIEELRRTVPLD